ncbi:neural cell adhesion molecule 1a isoform X12 [Denticeps clupeoides]|uniref:neural cell adhesion molecule 1a isoform X12 n=1 Tax=Denticeps clupeoides TaxID=299321 RepID=UPI0010A34A37|nr:neural cell adhesion molecule 1-like isoform X12 [Denticeps clupeoides]
MLQTRDIIWTLLFFGYAASLQVEITPPQGEISVGESKFFLCEVVGDAKEITWFAPSGEKILPGRQDISVSTAEDSVSSLTIYNANVDNAGIYKCVAKNGDKEAQATVTVKIFQKITFHNAPSPQEFNEGDDAIIVCNVTSSPPPAVFWKYKNKKIQMEKDVRFKVLSNNFLQIRGIKKTDEGDYTCEARIMIRGEIDLRVIKVIVNVLPSIRARQIEVNATANLKHSVMLACDADGYPEPIVTWARNNVIIESDEKYSLNEDGSELTIRDVTKVDEGDYRCIARNKAGEKEEEVSLNVFEQPKITYLENQTASELEEQIMFTCEATGDPTPTIIWSSGRRVFTEGEQASWTRPTKHKSLDGNVVVRSDARVSSLILKYVQFTDAGQYLCTARNSIGQDSKTMYLEVRYAPKIQGSVAVYTWEGNAANISCEVLAHPGASVVWFRDGQQLPSGNSSNVKIYNTPAVSFLEVLPESQSDFGSYNCTAANSIGSESKEFLLIQADVPSMPSIERVEPYSSTALVEFDEPDSSGGVPILKYKAEWRAMGQEWNTREYDAEDGLNMITIVGLKPETTYEVRMSAINGKGEGESSAPENFKTAPVRTIESSTGLGTGAIVGILIVVFLLLLVGVDVTCYFLNKCGLLMCIAVNFCGKAGPGAKSKDMEEGKAAFTKDESKEPIVEVRTEDEHTPNHEGGGPTEPNETTPLTDPEHATDTAATVVDLLPSVTANSDPVTDTFSTAQNSPTSEMSTLTSSAADPKSTPETAPQTGSSKMAAASIPAAPASMEATLVDLSDTVATKAAEAPKAAPASNPHPITSEPLKASEATQGTGSCQIPPIPSSKDSQVDGGTIQTSETEHPKDTPTSNQEDGKIVANEKSKSEETAEPNKTPAEVKTVPNEAAQTNGSESKA